MKAMVYKKYGSTNVLALTEIPQPIPQANEILVKVHAVSVNSWDWDLVRGKPFLARIGGLLKPKYNILGADIAGKVEAVGKEVKHFQQGDDVFGDISGCGWGGFSEYVCINEDALSFMPTRMTFEQAAALPQAGVLALQGLRKKGQIRGGESVLINGAGGGVGTFALQIAQSMGAQVTCVDQGGKLDLLKSMGADQVIDYTKEDFVKKGLHYDLILDVVGNRTLFDYKRVLKTNGMYVMVGGSFQLISQVLLLGPMISKSEQRHFTILVHKPNKQDQNSLRELFEAGTVNPVIDRVYSLDQVPEAIQYLAEGHAKGKVVISINSGE